MSKTNGDEKTKPKSTTTTTTQPKPLKEMHITSYFITGLSKMEYAERRKKLFEAEAERDRKRLEELIKKQRYYFWILILIILLYFIFPLFLNIIFEYFFLLKKRELEQLELDKMSNMIDEDHRKVIEEQRRKLEEEQRLFELRSKDRETNHIGK